MDRRSFLTAASTLALGTALTGCNLQNQTGLKIRLLKNSIPAQLLNKFRRELPNQQLKLDFKPENQLQALFTLLQTWKRQNGQPQTPSTIAIPFLPQSDDATPPDLVTLGDYWLQTAIRQGLIQPLKAESWSQWKQVPLRWQELVTRDDRGLPSLKGKVWAAPYRWGSTVIVYRKDIFRQKDLLPPTDWGDLWREDLQGRISLPDQPREVIGLTLKHLGKSYNTTDLSTVPDLEPELRSLQKQVKFYSSDTYLQPLLLEDTWVAVGWSTDVLPLMQRGQPIEAVFPASGTALWTDLWVRPATSNTLSPLLAEWINFCWQPDIAAQLSLLSFAASPILPTLNATTLPHSLQSNPLLSPKAEVLDRSEFLEPLPEATVEEYRRLWEKLRRFQ
ncbi:MAG: extracellular solute-binding protein [Leptolyngbyaceae cyanobacterium CSU_1_3]|nr:extracellular solute-binding protein [Leptolyngbyaceae cyanobacterium CSU_1_3]